MGSGGSVMRVLVTGAAGLVGSEVAAFFGHNSLEHHEVVLLTHDQLDISDRDAVEQTLGTLLPDAVINCAAYADVDGCERDPDTALLVNALGPRHLAIAAARVGAHLVHVSTDYVFSGDKGEPYDEWDEPAPVSAYGRAKLGGEREVMRHAGSWSIARTALVFGRRRPTFVDMVMDRARTGEPIYGVDDVIGSPTSATDVARVLARLAIERREGCFHVANAGSCSRYELALDVLELAGMDPAKVTRSTAADLPWIARRPRNSALASIALQRAGIPALRHYREALEEHIREMKHQ